jgi:uncharacterized protein (TIGR03435 family)
VLRPAILALVCLFAFAQDKPEFEVASIKSAPPLVGGSQVNIGVHVDGAQVNITSLSLKDYLRTAYQVKDFQIVGPDWMGQERYALSAKLPSPDMRNKIPEMLQNLLIERFKIKLHRESREFPVYALVVAKGGPKLKEAAAETEAPSSGPSSDGGGVNVNVNAGQAGVRIDRGHGSFFAFGDNQIEGRKLPMPDFVDILWRFTDKPVIDNTELKGAYDFVIKLTPEDYRAMLIRSAIAAGVALPPEALRALEMSSGDSLTSALQVLGLKLDSRKAPLDVIVIDQAEKKPIEN